MTNPNSSYYPPRANALSSILGRVDACARRLTKASFQLTGNVTLLSFVGGLLVPGLAIYLRKPGRSGRAALAVCAMLLLIFIVFLGFPLANAAFTLLLSIHVVGFVALCGPLLSGARLPYRLMAGLMLCAATIIVVYLPLQDLMERRLFVPLRVRGHVVVVHCFRFPGVIRRGEWIAFRAPTGRDFFNDGVRHGAVQIAEGINLAPVLATQGDHVGFTPESFSVNGIAYPRQANMPVSGELTVPENCMFAWPDLGISGHGNVPQANIATMAVRLATVHRDQFVGKAFRHWFGRRQLFS